MIFKATIRKAPPIKLIFKTMMIIFIITQISTTKAEVWFDENIHLTDMIQVKLKNDVPVYVNNKKLMADSAQFNLIDEINELNQFDWQKVFAEDQQQLKSWRDKAMAIKQQSYADLTQFYYLSLPNISVSEVKRTIEQLKGFNLVEGIYPIAKPVSPPLPPDYQEPNDDNIDNPYGNMYQRYLGAAPDGLDVDYARQGIGGKGDGISICDVEYGFASHSDQGPIIPLRNPHQDYPEAYYDHGTAVMGLLKSQDNGWGTTGMVTESSMLFSPARAINGSYNVASAILLCMNNLDVGDVILIEQQTSGRNGQFVPSEWNPAVHAMIKLATTMGYVVVEAAGNGSEDLDHPFYQTAQPGFAPFTAANDSGAIIVGSARSPWDVAPRTRLDSSTYGSTVDLHAWGQDIIAPGYGRYYDDEGNTLSYTLFGGTSGASPMVSAAVAILQANYIAKNSAPASASEIKVMLRNTGTPQQSINGQNIGPMPNLKAAIDALWDFDDIAAPVLSHPSGTYAMPLQFSIDFGSGDAASNTHIRYTLDGSEPTIDSFIFLPQQGDSIYLNYGLTIKAKSFKNVAAAGRLFASQTSTSTIISSTPKVATPQIIPNGGEFEQGTSVIITSETLGARIRYRTDGRTPSFFYPGTLYSGPFTPSPGSYNITARGYKDGYYKSDVARAEQLTIRPITLPSPVFYPPEGTYYGETTLYLGSTVLGAIIRYTDDGSEPIETSAIFVEPISIDTDTTIKAKVYLGNYEPSETVETNYEIISQLSPPIIMPGDGATADDSMLVTLSTNDSGASIRYTRNGTEPTNYSQLYNAPFELSPGEHKIKAKAFLSGAQASESSEANLRVFDTSFVISPPRIEPQGGIFNAPVTITMTSDTDGASFIFYTLDGTDPETSGTVRSYNGPFELPASPNSYFIRARAFLSGFGNSAISPATFTVVDPVLGTVADPVITPESGTYHNSIAIRVEAPDFSSPFNIRRLYVTTNGDVPFSDFSSVGQGASGVDQFNLARTASVQAISAQAGWSDSQVVRNNYAFQCAPPEILTPGTYIDQTTVTITTETTNADIYYTLDGSEPDVNSTLYDGGITLFDDHVLKAICARNNFANSEVTTGVFVVDPKPQVPVIDTQPLGSVVQPCQTAVLSVAASGTGVLSYQWYKDGDVVAGADEPELLIHATKPEDSGDYQVLVSNTAGVTVSQLATLVVPIFINSFEATDQANNCNNNSITNTDADNELLYTKSEGFNNAYTNQQSIHNNPDNTLSQKVLIIKRVANMQNNQSTFDTLVQRGDLPPSKVYVIPTLSFWARCLLGIILMIVAVNYQRNRCYR